LPEFIEEKVKSKSNKPSPPKNNKESSSSSSSSSKKKEDEEEVVMVKAWKEVCRTRSITAHVHNLVASPPLVGAGRIGKKLSSSSSSSSTSNSTSGAAGDADDVGWEITAREIQLQKNRQRFESGYLFVPERPIPVENDPSQSVENNDSGSGGVNRMKKDITKKKKGASAAALVAKHAGGANTGSTGGGSTGRVERGNVMTQMLPPNDASKVRRMIYVFRSRIENMRDPTIKRYTSFPLTSKSLYSLVIPSCTLAFDI
jgi:hypothetical protein